MDPRVPHCGGRSSFLARRVWTSCMRRATRARKRRMNSLPGLHTYLAQLVQGLDQRNAVVPEVWGSSQISHLGPVHEIFPRGARRVLLLEVSHRASCVQVQRFRVPMPQLTDWRRCNIVEFLKALEPLERPVRQYPSTEYLCRINSSKKKL